MLNTIIIFLPVAFCLFWMVSLCLWASRTNFFWLLMLVHANLLVFLITDSSYLMPGVSYLTLAVMGLISQLVTPSILPLAWLYLEKLRIGKDNLHHPSHYMWVVWPVMLFTAGVVLTSLIGFSEAKEFFARLYTEGNSIAKEFKGNILYTYYLWIVVFFRLVLIGELLSFFTWLVMVVKKERVSFKNILNFFRRGKPVRMFEIQLFSLVPVAIIFASKLFLFKDFTDTHQWVVIILNIFVSTAFLLFAVFTLFNSRKTITLAQMRHAFLYNYSDSTKADYVEEVVGDLVDEAEEDALRRIRKKLNVTQPEDDAPAPRATVNTLFSAVSDSWEEDSLMSRFQHLMMEEQLFLQPGLTLQDVADKLHTNKTYVSKLVNNTYNLGFPELINILRVDYAEQYLLNHRDAIQTEVASACGFQSASSFNIIFKKITGVTPRVWAASRESQ